MFSLKRLIKSFRYAMSGLVNIWRSEQNFRLQSMISLGVVAAMVIFHVTREEAIVLIMLIIFVLVLEVANTITEKMVDILKPRMHSYVEVIKDMMAAAVFISALGSAIIGLMIFIPYFVAFFKDLIYNT